MGQVAYRKEVEVKSYDSDNWTEEDGIITGWDGGNADDEDWEILPATDADMSVEGDVLDDTDLRTDGTRSRIIGLLDWTISGTLNYEPGIDGFDTMKSEFFSRGLVTVRYLPEGTTDSAEGYMGVAVVENFSHSGGVEDLETVDFSLPSNSILLNGEGDEI